MKYSFSALTLTGLLGLTAPVEAGLRAACRSQCAPLFAQECGGLCGRPSRKCRAGIVQDCRHFLRRYHWPLTSLCRARPDVHGAWRFDGTLVHDGCALARDLCVGITTRIGVATQEAESVGEDRLVGSIGANAPITVLTERPAGGVVRPPALGIVWELVGFYQNRGSRQEGFGGEVKVSVEGEGSPAPAALEFSFPDHPLLGACLTLFRGMVERVDPVFNLSVCH